MTKPLWKAESGDKVRTVDSENFDGYGDSNEWVRKQAGQRDDAIKLLKPNTTYTVDYVEDHGWSSVVCVKEVPGVRFNGVFFDDLVDDDHRDIGEMIKDEQL